MVEVTEAIVANYEEKGAVCLRGAFDPYWVELVREGVASALKNPGPSGERYAGTDDKGAFFGDLDMWQREDAFREFVYDSPASSLVAQLMKSETVTFFYDQMLVKEPGSEATTPWHQDQPYWAVSGRQVCSIWMPVDPVSKEVCLEFVSGSHNWNQEFMPQHFRDLSPYEGRDLPKMPDIEANRDDYEILSWEMEPGDCIVFQAMMVHGSKGNSSRNNRRRVLASRWLGDDARYLVRQGEVAIPTSDPGLEDGAPYSGPLYPKVWPIQATR